MDVRARFCLAVVGVSLYAVASHELTSRATDSAFALVVVLGPMVFALASAAWGSGRRGLAMLIGAAAVVAAAFSTQGRGVPAPWLYFAQHAGMQAALGIWFASSLSGEPMITQLASRIHHLTPDMRAYTRHCTMAWVVYFAAMTATSALLFAAAPLAAWSLFANVLTPVALGLMFVGEHIVRYRLHPEFERVTLMAAVQAFTLAPTTARGGR